MAEPSLFPPREPDAPRGPRRRLVGQGPAAGERFLLERASTIIGRAEDCDVRLKDPLASRRHAEVRRESWRYLLLDLGSRNGTRVNGEVVTASHHLQHGDTILIASVPLRFEDPNATVPVARDALRQAHLPVWVDAGRGAAYAFGRPLELTPKEYSLLALLFERPAANCATRTRSPTPCGRSTTAWSTTTTSKPRSAGCARSWPRPGPAQTPWSR